MVHILKKCKCKCRDWEDKHTCPLYIAFYSILTWYILTWYFLQYIDLVYRASHKHSLICLIPTFNWVWISNFFGIATSDTEAATTGQGNSKSADKWIPAIAILTSGLALSLTLFTAYHFISKKYGTGYRAWRKMTSRENELDHSLLMTSNHL